MVIFSQIRAVSTRHMHAKNHLMQGVAAVELAIVLPLLILLVFGVAEYGRMLYQYNTLVKSVRDGAKLLSVVSDTSPNYATYQTQAKCLVVYGNTGCSGDALVTGLATTDVNISETNSGSVDMVTVTVSDFSLGYITSFFADDLGFGDISITMRQVDA